MCGLSGLCFLFFVKITVIVLYYDIEPEVVHVATSTKVYKVHNEHYNIAIASGMCWNT